MEKEDMYWAGVAHGTPVEFLEAWPADLERLKTEGNVGVIVGGAFLRFYPVKADGKGRFCPVYEPSDGEPVLYRWKAYGECRHDGVLYLLCASQCVSVL